MRKLRKSRKLSCISFVSYFRVPCFMFWLSINNISSFKPSAGIPGLFFFFSGASVIIASVSAARVSPSIYAESVSFIFLHSEVFSKPKNYQKQNTPEYTHSDKIYKIVMIMSDNE